VSAASIFLLKLRCIGGLHLVVTGQTDVVTAGLRAPMGVRLACLEKTCGHPAHCPPWSNHPGSQTLASCRGHDM